MTKEIKMSICTYNSGDFEVIIKKGYEEITLSGNQKITDEEFEFVNDIAPACVFTTYIKK